MLSTEIMRLEKTQPCFGGTHSLAHPLFVVRSNSTLSQWIWPSSLHRFWPLVLNVHRTTSLFLLPPFPKLSFSSTHIFPHDIYSSCSHLTQSLLCRVLLLLLLLSLFIFYTCDSHCVVVERKGLIYLHTPASPIPDFLEKMSSKK